MYKPGDIVIYRKHKENPHPEASPMVHDITPDPRGENYGYFVDKFWVVIETTKDTVKVQTPHGKIHILPRKDPHLSKLHWWQKLLLKLV